MTPTIKTFAEFLHPNPERPGTVEYSLREVVNQDPQTLPGPPFDAIGVRFFVVVSVCVDHPDRPGEPLECQSKRMRQGPTYFYKNRVKKAGVGVLRKAR